MPRAVTSRNLFWMNTPARPRWLCALLIVLCSNLLAPAAVWGIPSADVRQLFTKPPRGFSSAPLWVWNDQLTEQQIVETLGDLAGQQVKQVFVHPRPGLMTSYLSPDWFRLWKMALREAERLDMNVWIYDENSYPSGFAGGWVPELMPESRGRGLELKATQEPPRWSTNLVAVYRITGEKVENVTSSIRAGTVLGDGGSYVTASMLRAGNSPWHGDRCYVDLLYPGVTDKFLDVTLKAYQREIGAQFGRRVPGIFTDEPNIIPAGGLPWTEDLPAQFQRRCGYDLLDNLASLHQEIGNWRQVRHDYFSVLNQLFIERWAQPYAERCTALGLEMTGHYWEHDWPHCRGVPDNMAMYAWPQRPAIDCLMNQYAENTHAQFGNIRMVRELGSVANQLGKSRTLCEVYGAGGWDLRFEDMKRQADWLGVLGVNTFDQHLSYVTIRGARKRDHPQSFSYHEPWWPDYKSAGAYLERLSVAVSQGEQVNRILVLEPTTTAWMNQGSEARLKVLGDSFFDLLKRLEAAQVEYDLGCEDIIQRHGSVVGAELTIGNRRYATIVLPPGLENLEEATGRFLDALTAAGGRIIACKPTAAPGQLRRGGKVVTQNGPAADASWPVVDTADVANILLRESSPPSFTLRRGAEDRGILFHMRRQLDDGELLFLVNTSIDASSSGSIHSAQHGIEQWDLETGQVQAYPFEPDGSGIKAEFTLPPCGSRLLFLSRASRPSFVVRSETVSPLAASGPMTVDRIAPNVLVLDYVDISAGGETRTNIYFYAASQFAFRKNGLERNPWDSAVQFKDELVRRSFPAGSGFEASYHFTVEGAVPSDLAIVLERPDLYEVRCNGHVIAAAPGAWWLDKAFGRIELARVAQSGVNTVSLRASPFTLQHELESAYLLGDFAVRPAASGFVLTAAQAMRPGAWNEQGCPFYAAGVRYQQTFEIDTAGQDRFVVGLGKWLGSVARVRVNGQQAGTIGYAPWQCDVSGLLRNGANTVEVVAVGTLKNTLGPHHGNPSLGTAWPGMFQKGPTAGPPPGADYATVKYGLFEPFQLRRIKVQ